jgi:hypothetical protein
VKSKRSAEPKPIEMDGLLPRYREDDVEFVVRNLMRFEPTNIAQFVQRMGLPLHSQSGNGKSSAYFRIASAFARGLEMGMLTKNLGRDSWRVAVRRT